METIKHTLTTLFMSALVVLAVSSHARADGGHGQRPAGKDVAQISGAIKIDNDLGPHLRGRCEDIVVRVSDRASRRPLMVTKAKGVLASGTCVYHAEAPLPGQRAVIVTADYQGKLQLPESYFLVGAVSPALTVRPNSRILRNLAIGLGWLE